MIELSAWHRTTFKYGQKEWEEYCLVVNNVNGNLTQKYAVGQEEKFSDVYKIGQRLAQLQREDFDASVIVTSGFVYSREENRFINGSAYVPLDNNKLQINKPLNGWEIEEMSNEMLRTLKGN